MAGYGRKVCRCLTLNVEMIVELDHRIGECESIPNAIMDVDPQVSLTR